MIFDCRKNDRSRRFAKVVRLGAVVLAVAVLFLGFGAAELFAADGEWPTVNLAKDFRGPGNYLSLVKIILSWLVFFLWVWTTDWVSTDAQNLKLDYMRWNSIVFGTFMAAFVLMWMIPFFWVSLVLLLIAYIAPLTTYIVLRNKTVDNSRQVMTAEHLRYWFAIKLRLLGVKIDAERRDPHETGAPVKLTARGGPDDRTNSARLMLARQSAGMSPAREIIADGFASRATAIMLDYSQQGVAVRNMVDGVWIARQGIDRETGDAALESLKLLCGLNPQDRKNRQDGQFLAEYESIRYAATLASQGTAGGERVVLQFEDKKVRFKTLDDLGMRAKLQEQYKEVLEAKSGFVIFSAPPANGLRSTTDVSLHICDRFIREFATLEEEHNRYEPIENIPAMTYNASEGQTPIDVLPRLFRTEPNAVVLRDLVNAQTVDMLCEQITENNRLIISTVRAKDCVEALLRVLSLGASGEEFAKVITGVINQRLLRKLCDSCKEAYAPTPQMLQQLGIPAGRVQAFYRPPQPNPNEPSKEPCQVCGGLGYMGRTAIFELLVAGDNVRKVLGSDPTPDRLRQAARKDGMKTLQEEGVLLVAKGVTSLQELMRVLK